MGLGGVINVIIYCRCVRYMTALRRSPARYINSSLADPCVIEGLTGFVKLRPPPNNISVHKTGKLSTHFIYFNIYTNDNKSNLKLV